MKRRRRFENRVDAMAEIYHLNFHTNGNQPIFLDDEYALTMDLDLTEIIRHHEIVCLARAVMPTHVHFVVVAFPDQPRERIVQFLKGASSYAFFQRYPAIADELDHHLWQKGYQWVLITSHEQLIAAIRYVRANRSKIGLRPIVPEAKQSE